MPIPIGKAEFYRRLNSAVVMHQERIRGINSNTDLNERDRAIAQWQCATKSAKTNKLPAVGQPLNPMVAAIMKISGTYGQQATYLEVMELSERAWEYLLNDLDAHVLFKKLNP